MNSKVVDLNTNLLIIIFIESDLNIPFKDRYSLDTKQATSESFHYYLGRRKSQHTISPILKMRKKKLSTKSYLSMKPSGN